MFSNNLILLATLFNFGGDTAPATQPVTATPAAPQAIDEAQPAAKSHKAQRVATRLDADEVAGKVQSFYKNTQQLTALFRQTYTNSTFGKTSVSDGKVWIKKPGKMRWDYINKKRKSKINKSFISDGSMLWVVEHDNQQVIRTKIKEDVLPVAVTFLFGKGELT